MKKKIILFCALIIVGVIAKNQNREIDKSLSNRADAFKMNILNDIGGMKKYWSKLEFTHNSVSDFNFIITYNRESTPEIVAREETEQVVRASLKRLMTEGRIPTKEMTFINVTAYQDAGLGETGEPLVRNLGTARYNMNHDKIEFTEYKK